MSVFFRASEIFKFAIRIEENGERFYRHAVEVTEDNNSKEMFAYLADEENKHKKMFKNLTSRMEEYTPFESYPGEYLAYLRSFIDKIIFANEEFDREIREIKDISSALDFGIQRELDSLLYYYEMRRFVPKSQHKLIDKIIDEERKHFSQLSELKKKIR